MKVTKFDRVACKLVRHKIDQALHEVALECGISIQTGKGRFDPSAGTFDLTLNMGIINEDGTAASAEAAEFVAGCGIFGFDPSDLGKIFKHRGADYQITGLSSRAPKYPLKAKQVATGKGYKFPADVVLRALGKEAA